MKKLILLFIFSLSSFFVSATHLRGGYISVKRISGRTCEVTVTVFTDNDCPGECVLFGGYGDVLDFGDNTSMLVPETPNRVTDFPHVGKASFTVWHTFPGNGIYTLSYREPNRNEGVLNMSGSNSTTFYIETKINLSVNGSLSSPSIIFQPVNVASKGVAFYYNAGAYDQDGDSLSYELTIPYRDRHTGVSNYRNPDHTDFYAGLNYDQANEEGDGQPTFSINPTNGTLKWDAPGQTGEYGIAFIIKEWRIVNNVWVNIGFVRLDRQIIVVDSNNKRPDVTIPEDITVEAGTDINETFMGTDPASKNIKIEVSSEAILLLNGASVQPESSAFQVPPSEKLFTWTPTNAHVRSLPYSVIIRVSNTSVTGPSLATFKVWNIKVTETPTTIKSNAPIITQVTVDKTGDSDGEIKVRWTTPYDVDEISYPPPYQYIVRRNDGSGFVNASSKISDTVYIDLGLNTRNQPYTYRVVFFSPSSIDPIDTSSTAASVWLDLSAEEKIQLSWNADVPWSNRLQEFPIHKIFKGTLGDSEETMVLVDSINSLNGGLRYIDFAEMGNTIAIE